MKLQFISRFESGLMFYYTYLQLHLISQLEILLHQVVIMFNVRLFHLNQLYRFVLYSILDKSYLNRVVGAAISQAERSLVEFGVFSLFGAPAESSSGIRHERRVFIKRSNRRVSMHPIGAT